ncbi:alpha/beta fold hydrolase [Kistimonas scapharcae]
MTTIRLKTLFGIPFLFSLLLLTACTRQDLYQTAMSLERQRAGLAPAEVVMDDLTVAYLAGGNPDGETILMVHGFGANKDNWVRLAGKLENQYRIIALDLPGHGDSSAPLELDYRMPAQAQRIADFIQTLELGQVHYMGNSMGGWIGMELARIQPDVLNSLVLLDNGGVEPPNASEFQHLLEQGENPLIVNQPGDMEKLLSFVMTDRPFIPWPITSVLEEQALAREPVNEKIFDDLLRSRDERLEGIPQSEWLAAITTPSLIIWGEDDRVLDVSSVSEMQKYMPTTEAVIFEEIGHLPMIEDPSAVAEAFLAFVEKQPSGISQSQ